MHVPSGRLETTWSSKILSYRVCGAVLGIACSSVGFQRLEMLDQLLGRAGEPGAELHIVVERWHAGLLPPATLGGRGHLRRGDARHKTQRREHFYVLFEVGRQLADRLLATVGDVKEDADSEVLAELEVLARPRGGVAIGLDRPLGHGGGAAADRSLD